MAGAPGSDAGRPGQRAASQPYSNVAPGCEGLQALLHALSGLTRHVDGDLDTALAEWVRAHDLAERSLQALHHIHTL